MERLGYEAYQLKPDRLLSEGLKRQKQREKLRNVKSVLKIETPQQYSHLRNRQSSGYKHAGVHCEYLTAGRRCTLLIEILASTMCLMLTGQVCRADVFVCLPLPARAQAARRAREPEAASELGTDLFTRP